MKNIKNALFGLLLMSSMSLVSAQNWAGSYIGLHLGTTDMKLEHSDSSNDFALGVPGSSSFVYKQDSNKSLGGLYFGHNYQFNNLVIGPELEFSLGNTRFEASKWQIPSAALDSGLDCSWCNYEISNSARVRVKAGYVYESSTLFFVSAGLSMAKFEYIDTDPAFGGYKGKLNGMNFGAGVEYAIHKKLSLRAEYIRDQYGEKSITVPGADQSFNARIKASADTYRIGLTYKF